MAARTSQKRSERQLRLERGRQDRRGIPAWAKVALGIAIAAAVALAALLVLSATPVFTISSIETEDTEHLSRDTIARLAAVEEGTTLLNVNVDEVAANVRKNPWAGQVSVSRHFPDRLKIEVIEREISAVVLMGSGNIAWYLGSDGRWIEPVTMDTSSEQAGSELALQKAQELGCLLIVDVPSSVSPQAGYEAADSCVTGALDYISEFSDEFAARIVSFSAANEDAIACTLDNGVVVSLGAPTNISAKQAVIEKILSEHPGQLTYINVRVPSKPTYRKVNTSSVAGAPEGTDQDLPDDDISTEQSLDTGSSEDSYDTEDAEVSSDDLDS